jgi:hypothetical protein
MHDIDEALLRQAHMGLSAMSQGCAAIRDVALTTLGYSGYRLLARRVDPCFGERGWTAKPKFHMEPDHGEEPPIPSAFTLAKCTGAHYADLALVVGCAVVSRHPPAAGGYRLTIGTEVLITPIALA